MNHYIACIEVEDLELEEHLGCKYFYTRAKDKVEAHQKIHKWIFELCDRIERDYYIFIEDNTRERVESISQIITLGDLEKVLPMIE